MTDTHDRAGDAQMQIWVRLTRMHQGILKAVESALKRAGFPPLQWYDVLLELERAGDEGLRQRDIQKHTLLERYNVSRLVDRLEAAGYASRRPAPGDGRGALVRITGPGRDVRRAMWPIYRQAVAEQFADALSKAETTDFSRLLDKMFEGPLSGDGRL